MMDASNIQRDWQSRGRMTLCAKGRPSFPVIEAKPGVYKLVLDSKWLYFGEAKNLQARLACYVPGNTGLEQETRLHLALTEAGGADVYVITGEDLATKPARCAIETSEIVKAKAIGEKVLNGAQKFDPYVIALDIRFHEKAITALKARLSALTNGEKAS